MSWLNDFSKSTVYKYINTDDEEDIIYGTSEELRDYFEVESVKAEPGEVLYLMVNHNPDDSIKYRYAGFEPKQVGILTKITFEKNGRKAIRIKNPDGKTHIRSMSRENLYKGKGVTETGMKRDASGELTGKKSYEVDSVLTKSCREVSDKVKGTVLHNRLQGMKKQLEKENANRRKK